MSSVERRPEITSPKDRDALSISGVLGSLASGEGGHAILGYGGNGGPVRFMGGLGALMILEMRRKRKEKEKSRSASR